MKPLGPVPVKGLSEPVEVYELAGAGAARTRLQAASARGLTRFVGRDAEMDQLRAAAEQAGGGRGQMVAVVGEPGVGKSRLFYEFIHSHRTHGWLVLESSSVSYGKATSAYLPLIDLLKGYFKIDDRDDMRAVRAKVTGTMLTLDEGLKDFVPAGALAARGAARRSGVPRTRAGSAASAHAGGDPAARAAREPRAAAARLFSRTCTGWTAETQAFLDSLVESLPAVAILLAVNYRPEYQHGWGRKTYYRQLRIDPLPPESAEALLTTLLGERPERRAVAARVDRDGRRATRSSSRKACGPWWRRARSSASAAATTS